MPTFDLTTILAIWGALLSTVLAIREFAKDRRSIKVQCQMGTPWPPVDAYGRHHDDMVIITAVNTGQRPINITGMGFTLSDQRQIVLIEDAFGPRPLPKTLTEGDSVSMNMLVPTLTQEILRERQATTQSGIKVRSAFVKDSTGKIWTCSPPQVLIDRGLAG